MAHADQADTDAREVRPASPTPSRYYESGAGRARIERRVQVLAMSRQVFTP